jgi:methyl-accepting chemotaxis protein
LFLFSSFLLAQYIVRPISEAADCADAIRNGDLSRRITVTGLNEARRLGSSVNHMAQSFVDYNQQILEGVKVLSDSVAQIATTASELFTSASRTAAAVSETTATVNEMEGTAKVVNETSGRIAKHSEESYEIANTGSKATGDTLQKMNLIKDKMDIVAQAVVGLSENAKYVEDIVAAVQDLADQSNLLAVNASIEASHAGDHGKGFAVVAHEIKSLADQSRDATAKISKILQEIRSSVSSVVMATEEGGKAVQSGVEQSEAAGASIQQLAQSINETAQGAGVIYSTSSNQFGRVERVAGAMRSIELAMQDSVAGTTQLENQAKRLEQLALSLKGLVGRIKFG